ncbi:MAG: silent information regulator protein Sir2, partial [Verrucomicrobiae bacterium]|nr:silent information regulator protein Sir2 [Verrucomicrobiae bacterium]
CNFVCRPPEKGLKYYYVRAVKPGTAWHSSSRPVRALKVKGEIACVTIRLRGDYPFNKVGLGDLDGNGQLDFVIKQPAQVTDPGVWRPSVDTWKVEAYLGDGTFLWRKDLGWNIEQGVWWSPMIVYDLDGDGRAEVALKTAPTDKDYRNPAGRVLTGPEYCSVLDGLTGRELARVDWIPRGNVEDWGDSTGNRASRHLMGVAYLDGRRPSLIIARGTYTRMVVRAYNFAGGRLDLVWEWDGEKETTPVRGQGAHGMHAADVDGDGRDELVLGAAVLDDDGKLLWNLGQGHPDICYVADIDPARPGLEIAYGFEPAHWSNGICVVEARTGRLIWGAVHPTRHVHSQGLLADIDPANPGLELYAGEKYLPERWLYCARTGKLLGQPDLGSLAPNPVFWTDGQIKAYVNAGKLVTYSGQVLGPIEGRVVAVADCLGDWREELITSVPGELRIYTSTIPARTRRVCLLQDRLYRTDVAMGAMGYLYPPQVCGVLFAEFPMPARQH